MKRPAGHTCIQPPSMACDACMDDYASSDFTDLQRDLDELERTDPAVRAATRSYDAMIERITGRRLNPPS